MKLLKFILPISALLMVFAVVESTAQICVYNENRKYSLEDVVANKCDGLSDEVNLKFLKFCCDSLDKCNPNYLVEGKYRLTHIAAKYNRRAALEYLITEKNIPSDSYPLNLERGEYEKTYTPIMLAIQNKAFECVEYLINIGVNITRTNIYGETPLSLAKATGNQRMISLVQAAWNKAKGYSYNQIEQEKAKLRNLLKPEAIQKHFAQNTVVQTTKPFIQSAAQAQEFKQI